jgi:hypothetical protein
MCNTIFEKLEQPIFSHDLGPKIGALDPILVEHTGFPSGSEQFQIGRTDTELYPSSEVLLPAGGASNSRSADCSGGYFLVGPGGSVDFGSPEGTISLWIKWDVSSPHGRFWGQDGNFETRWESNRLRLDWGSDNTFLGTKNDWVPNNWYFISIVWDQSVNFLGIYWGDEETEPIEDASTLSWADSVIGLHSENDIMNSRAYTTGQVDGHVDDFRYYTLARSLEDIKSDYNKTLSGNMDGLVHHYEFEDDLTDSAGAANLVSSGSYSFSKDVIVGIGGWRAEQIEVDIQDLRILHALNGTFDNGNPGENEDYDLDDDGPYYADGWRARREVLTELGRQRAAYIDTSPKYLVVENQGYYYYLSDSYRHYNGTKIYWYQIVNNSLLTEQFEFSINYLYQRGPIGNNYSDAFRFSFDILDGSDLLWNWTIDPTNITERGIWYQITPITVDIPGAPSSFEIRISLEVNTISSYVQISETDPNLDGDPTNGRFVTLLIDDVSLRAAEGPNLESVEFAINIAPLGSIPIPGSTGIGTILLDHNYWRKAANLFSFSSNSSISFEYFARITKMTRFSNSTYSTNLENLGVAYSIEPDGMPEFSLYTYIQSYADATGIGIRVHHPEDWDNPRVESPFGSDVSTQANLGPGYLEIPSGVIDSVGWWKIMFSGPNYADSVITQVPDDYGITWIDETRYDSGDRIRCRANLGTDLNSVQNVEDVEIAWYLPSGGIWFNELTDNSNGSSVISQTTTLGPINATVGEWIVSVSWSNGSEVGYGYTTFELYHQFTIFANTPNIEIESGDEFTVAIYLYDQDNGNPILSDADVNGNWSSTAVSFNPNLAKGWWEADFNTTHLGYGEFVIVVEVSMPFFEMSSTIVSVRVPGADYDLILRAGILGALMVTISIGAITLSRRFYLVSTVKRNLELMVLEGRLDDAKNLIGLLVIHRSIGLPVYSNILKGGFQEALLSSFISAISHFRSEFSMEEPTWTAIPITEVITAVQTDALICAIVTVESASKRQKTQLETFGREVGGLYDHEDDTIRTMVRSPTLTDTFDAIFESYFDGHLMKRYVGVKKSLPKHLHAVSTALDKMEIDHGVSVDAIIKSTSILGYSERRAHSMVLEAVDDGYLIAAERKLPPPIKTED